MQVEVALLGWQHKNKRIKCYRAREGGGGGGGRDCTLVHIPVYMYMIECCQNSIRKYLAMTVPLERACSTA